MASRPINAYGMPNGTYNQTSPFGTPPDTNTNPGAQMSKGGQPGPPQRLSDPSQGGIPMPGDPAQMPPHLGAQSGPVNGDYQSWFQNLVQGQPSSYGLIKQLEPTLNNAGIQVHNNLEGDPSKLVLPNGHYISAVDANGAWRWMDQGTPQSNAAHQQQQQPNAALMGALGGSLGGDAQAQAQGAGNYGQQTAQNVMQSLALKQALGAQRTPQSY